MNTVADPANPGAATAPPDGEKAALKMPPYFLYVVVAICLAPYLLSLLGADFSSSSRAIDLREAVDLPEHQQLEVFFTRLSGAFTHTILEWTAFCVAILTVFLAASHYAISKNLTTLVIGAALFFGRLHGCFSHPGCRPLNSCGR